MAKARGKHSAKPQGTPRPKPSSPNALLLLGALGLVLAVVGYLAPSHATQSDASEAPSSPPTVQHRQSATKSIRLFSIGQHFNEPPISVKNLTASDWSHAFREHRPLDVNGARTSFEKAQDGDAVYVLESRNKALHWIWPSGPLGSRRVVTDIDHPKELPIEIETLSTAPRVFFVHNFMSDEEVG